MDIRTYDQAETLARKGLETWPITDEFTPYLLSAGGFPLRLDSIHELRAIYGNNQDIFQPIELELRGLSDDDRARYEAGSLNFLRFYRSLFYDDKVPVPDALLLHVFSTYCRLEGLPFRARILEIGPGIGALPLFFDDDFGVETYDQLEVTQSMYISQSLIGRFRFGHRFSELALDMPTKVRVGELGLASVPSSKHRPAKKVIIDVKSAATHFPWWRTDDAFGQRYNVVVSNHCLAELKPPILQYYATAMAQCLDDDGVLLIQGLGAQRGQLSAEHVLMILSGAGFRPLVYAPARKTNLSQFADNILAVKVTHSLADQAAPDFSKPFLAGNVPMVRAVYRLDRPVFPAVDRAAFLSALVERARQLLST